MDESQIKALDELIEKWIDAEDGWLSDHAVVTDKETEEWKAEGAEFRRRILGLS